MGNPCPSLWTDFKTAVAFLSRLPVRFVAPPPRLADTAWAFPLVGIAVALPAAAVLLASAALGLVHLVCALLALAVQMLATGALHEDGLADVADGFGGGHDKARKLEIMRDSRIGTYGILALLVSVGLRAGALAGYPGPVIGALALVAAGMVSRGMLPLLMLMMPPARDDGLGQGAGKPATAGTAVALVLGLAGALALPWLVAGPLAAIGLVAAVVAAPLLVARLALRQIGGQTGDVLGAAQQAGEVAYLVLLGVLL